MKTYQERMRDLREDNDLTQKQVADILNLTNQQTYQRYEAAKVETPIKLLIRLARLYNVSLDYLAGLTNNPKKFW